MDYMYNMLLQNKETATATGLHFHVELFKF